MRGFQDRTEVADLMQLIVSRLRQLPGESVPLREAAGRVLAGDVVSEVAVPPFDRAAMDGYAVRAEDTFGASRAEPRTLSCVEQVFTGQVPTRAIGAGQCAEIATGAPMPDGADAVVMVEETTADAGRVQIFTPVYPKQNVGRQGADIQAGQTVLAAGDVLNASRVGALAALGTTDVAVYRPSTGQWWVRNQFTVTWGLPTDVPVPGDYNGDGTADVAVYRPSTGQWWVRQQFTAAWGLPTDVPVPGDYNGDGVTDVAVFRPSTGQWFVRNQFTLPWGKWETCRCRRTTTTMA